MSQATCIYAPDPKLKEDAAILAKLRGKSFSKLVWDTMQEMVERDQERIRQYKEIISVNTSGRA